MCMFLFFCLYACMILPFPNKLMKKRIQFFSYILWTINLHGQTHDYFLVFLDCMQKLQAFVSNIFWVILSRYFVGACSWDGSSHSSELYSSRVCTNTLCWFHYRQSDRCKFTFLALSCFNNFKKKSSRWPVLDSIGFQNIVEEDDWGSDLTSKAWHHRRHGLSSRLFGFRWCVLHNRRNFGGSWRDAVQTLVSLS